MDQGDETRARCTCGARAGRPLPPVKRFSDLLTAATPEPVRHSVTCLTVAATQPNAMIDDDGDVYYPDNPEDADHFALHYGARPLDPDGFARVLGDVRVGPEGDQHGH